MPRRHTGGRAASGPGRGTMSARAPVPAARPREDPPTVAADREALLVAQPPGPERDGEEAAREERAAAATSAGARGEPSPAPVRGHSVPQAAVPVRPLALHLAHKARGPGGPFGLEPPPPPPRDVPAEDAPAPAGPEDKLPPPPKENPWTRRPPPCAAVTGAPAPPDVPVAGVWRCRRAGPRKWTGGAGGWTGRASASARAPGGDRGVRVNRGPGRSGGDELWLVGNQKRDWRALRLGEMGSSLGGGWGHGTGVLTPQCGLPRAAWFWL